MSLPASRARCLGLVLALVCSAPAGALAQAPPPPPPPAQPTLDPVAQEAQQLFVEGREAMKKGDYVTAARMLLRSQELHSAPGTRLNLAIVEEQLGHFARALEQFAHRRHVSGAPASVLIYASTAERQVEIVADEAIHAQTGDGVWNDAIKAALVKIRAGDPAGGLIAAIEQCGAALAQHFPAAGAANPEPADDLKEV